MTEGKLSMGIPDLPVEETVELNTDGLGILDCSPGEATTKNPLGIGVATKQQRKWSQLLQSPALHLVGNALGSHFMRSSMPDPAPTRPYRPSQSAASEDNHPFAFAPLPRAKAKEQHYSTKERPGDTAHPCLAPLSISLCQETPAAIKGRPWVAEALPVCLQPCKREPSADAIPASTAAPARMHLTQKQQRGRARLAAHRLCEARQSGTRRTKSGDSTGMFCTAQPQILSSNHHKDSQLSCCFALSFN